MPLRQVLHLFRRANANKGRVVRALARTGRHGFWAMVDQGIASLGTFGILFLLGREFAARQTIAQFGNFAMLFELMWFLNNVQGALIIYPLSVKGAMIDRPALARLAGGSVVLSLIGSPIVGGAVFIMAAVISTLSVAGWAAVAAIVWQVQETTRRALMADLRFKAAIWGDCIRYMGHLLIVWVMARSGHFSLELVFQMMVAASALAAVLQALQLRLHIPGASDILEFARDAWKLGRWVLAGNASSLFTSSLFTINFRFWWGAEIVGIAFVLNNLLRLTNPLMFTVASLVTPHAARARATEGIAASKRVLIKFTTLGGLILVPYLAVLIFLPGWCIRIATQDPEFQRYWWVLVIAAISQGLVYLGTVLGVYLNALERNRLAFIGQMVYSALFVVVGMPATAIFGIAGAAVGGCIAAAATLTVNFWAVKNLPAQEQPTASRRGFEVIPNPASATPAA